MQFHKLRVKSMAKHYPPLIPFGSILTQVNWRPDEFLSMNLTCLEMDNVGEQKRITSSLQIIITRERSTFQRWHLKKLVNEMER